MKTRAFNTGHLTRGYPLSLPQTPERIANMKATKQRQARFEKLSFAPKLEWKGKQ